MRNPATSQQKLSQPLSTEAKSRFLGWSVFFLLTVGLTGGWTLNARAESPATAPPQLKQALSQIDTAANRRDIKGVMQFYGANFKNSDGLTRASMEQALTQFWKRYSQLNYRTELQNWKSESNGIVAETVTNITGTQASEGTTMKLQTTLRSRQRIENQKIVQQEILAERSQVTSGANPPTVEVNLPDRVRPGQPFNFDAIVKEPLGDNLLLGTALEEPIKPDAYTKPTNLELELLPAGGIFKMGKAPLKPENRWVSAILIRGDGMTTITQRLQVGDRPSASTSPSR
jgi:hypothetical protein